MNRRFSLDLIRFTPGGISRAELARRIGLSRSAITSIINELLDFGLVREATNGPSSIGRRPILLEINPLRGFVAGVDIGATHLGILIADFSANIIWEMEKPFSIVAPPDDALQEVDLFLREALNSVNLNLNEVLAIGVAVPGPVVSEEGTVSMPPIMPGWDRFPIRRYLSNLWGCEITLNNDAELGALGEWAHGAGRGENNLAYIKVGSGVGAGLLLDGRIYRGATGSAGEIGHITVREDGPRCSCGSHGCLEALAGGQAIARRARHAVHSGRRTQLSNIKPSENITAKDVAEAARLGDLVAQQIIAETGSYLGIAIASLINLFNPSMVVVGGGVAQTGDLLLDPIRQAVRERSLPSAANVVRINTAVLGRRSTSMGAVVQALNLALDHLAGE